MNHEVPIGDPMIPLPAMREPFRRDLAPAEFMAFPKAVRDWWLRVTGGRCQYEFYTEKKGWQTCNLHATQVHHLTAETFQLHNREPIGNLVSEIMEPNGSVGFPTCKHHHMNEYGEQEEHSFGFSFHPDMGQAFKEYKEWKETARAMKHHGFKPPKTPFQEHHAAHIEMAQRGERYWQGTPEIDQHYAQKMIDLATQYISHHPEDPKPRYAPHHLSNRKWKWRTGRE